MAACVVGSMKELKDASNEKKYTQIVVVGEEAKHLAHKVKKYGKLNKASNVSMAIGVVVWPALIAGIGGKVHARPLRRYRVETVTEDGVVLEMKDKYREKYSL